MLANLRFILENEPEFPDCTKLFVLNRLFDPEREAAATKLIADHGAEALVIPFEPTAYADTGWNTGPFVSEHFFTSKTFGAQPKLMQDRMRIWACAPKIRYAMNINGARNAAIEVGRTHAEWTAVLDGNCIFTAAAFLRFRADCMADPFAPYVVIPMQRLEHNEDFGGKEPDPHSREEPQIAFHYTAQQAFDERFPYGLRDKTALLKSLGIPGPWQDWAQPPWLPKEEVNTAEKHFYKFSQGAVFRLSSGGSGFEQTGAHRRRYGARNLSIFSTVSALNALHGSRDPWKEKPILGEAGSASADGTDDSALLTKDQKRARKRMTSIYDNFPDIGALEGRTLFIGLGAMKAGTSWVSDYLRAHPDVFHSPIKEMNFFNTLDDNPLSAFGDSFRHRRMRQILLEKNWEYPPSRENYETLKTLAELGALETESDYLGYFARRIGKQTHFGEICPQYALIEPQTYRRIADMGFDTRLMFFMRDPTDRLASNIQHNLRRTTFDIDEVIETIKPDDNWFRRSDYKVTLENLRKADTGMPIQTFVYEDLFTEKTVRRLCEYLGISYRAPDFDKQVNVARGPKITRDQKDHIREKLEPLYAELSDYFGEDRPPQWRWTS